MAGEQDILDLGLNIESFNAQKMNTLREFIALFNDLSRYDGKIFNPVMGDGLSTLNTSIAQTNRLLEEMNQKLAAVSASSSRAASSNASNTKSNTELGQAVGQYAKQSDKAVELNAKLAAMNSDLAKEVAALKVQLSEKNKELIEEAKLANESIQNKIKETQRTEDYRIEQQRVVAVLRQVAIEQDRQLKTDNSERKRLAAAEYRAEQQRVVAVLRQLAIEQDREAASAIKSANAKKNATPILTQYANQTKEVSNHTSAFAIQTGNSVTKVESLGKTLTSTLTTLRYMAYILPGIGIAGIFNLAFEAIGAALEELGLFTNATEKQIEQNIKLNETFLEHIKNLEKINTALQDLADLNIGFQASTSSPIKPDIALAEKELALIEAQGQSKDEILATELKLADLRQKDADRELTKFGGEDIVLNQLKKSLKEIESIQGNINKINYAITHGLDYVDPELKKVISSKDTQEKRKKDLQTQFDVEQENAKKLFGLLKNNYDTIKDLDDKKAELDKFNADQERKRLVETSKESIATRLAAQKQILTNERNFHDEKEAAINREFELEKRAATIARISVTGTEQAPNVTTTPKERIIAFEKEAQEIERLRIKRQNDIDKNDTEFFQRRILAQTEIKKDEIEMSAIADEKIYQNEKHSLEERLAAYESYIIKKQQIKQLEYNLAIQKGASKEGGPTSLTPEEQSRVDTHKYTQQFNIQADAEKQVYNIVKTYLDERLKAVKLENDQEFEVNKDAYAKELSELNKRFEHKIYSYEAFSKNKAFIDKKYGVILSIEKEIERDDKNVQRLRDLTDELIRLKAESDKALEEKRNTLENPERVPTTSALDSKRSYDEELGKNNAFNDAIKKAQDELNDALEKGDDDRVKAAKARYEELTLFAKEHAANLKAIEQGIFDIAKKYANQGVEEKLRSIDDERNARQEQSALQKDAIDEANLSEKDKIALDRQAAQQKIELDKNAIREERKIKHDAAVKEREIAVAQIFWNTGQAVTSALKLPPPAGEILAAERTALGAIQIALLPPVPSYAEGITSTPKDEYARFAEKGPEYIKEPGKPGYVALTETISYLPKGTEIVPIKDDFPEFGVTKKDDSWEQMRYLAKQFAKSNKKEIKNIFKPNVIIDMGFERRKREIFGN